MVGFSSLPVRDGAKLVSIKVERQRNRRPEVADRSLSGPASEYFD